MAGDSSRFVVQMIMNLVLCNYAQKKIAKLSMKREGKRSLKSYLVFVLFAVSLFALNQAVFFFFKTPNLYQQLSIPRSMPPDQIKAYEDDLKIKIMQMQQNQMSLSEKVSNIKKLEAMVQVLTHPARRLSYDTFGETDTSYAWAFKSTYFLLQTLIQSSIFYIICTLLNLMSTKKGEVREVFKLQIMAMILLFLWEVELIMKTETRIHNHTDMLDNIYNAFPVFERREMIKIILIPCMNIIKIFYRFFIQNAGEKKLLQIVKNSNARNLTVKTSEACNKLPSPDPNFEDKIKLTLSQLKKKEGVNSEIYELQRECVYDLLSLERDNILIDEQMYQHLKYFAVQFQAAKV